MLIGVLSDSHGRAATTRRAVTQLLDAGAEMLLHLGDIETPEVIDELIGTPAHLVLGNCDWPEQPLLDYARLAGVSVEHPMGRLTIDGLRIAFTHGHLQNLVVEALEEQVAYLFTGHTHERHDQQHGATRWINPGALFRTSMYTAALIDLASDALTWIEIPRET